MNRLRSDSGFVCLANPESRRVTLFQEALERAGQAPARVVSYNDWLQGRIHLSKCVRPHDVVRIESPGQNWDVERQILMTGAHEAEHEAEREASSHAIEWMPREVVLKTPFEQGRIWPSRQWYLGWRRVLQKIDLQLSECPQHRVMNRPRDIALMFDKPYCQKTLQDNAVPVPTFLGTPQNFAELRLLMQQQNCTRVFVKLAHGSGASGVVAYRTDGKRHQAITTVETATVETESSEKQLRLYNSRRVRVLDSLSEIAQLVDALCRHRVYAEVWIPKAGFKGRTTDVRVVVINGKAQHSVARLSRSSMTNLHLLNERADTTALRARIGKTLWNDALCSCQRALSCFPDSLYAGIDLLWTPNFAQHRVLEVNAFGDLLLGTHWNGLSTYESEVRAALQEKF